MCDEHGKPIAFHLTAGQVSDYNGAKVLMRNIPPPHTMLADRGYDADWFRNALKALRITPCIPPRANRTRCIRYDKTLDKNRHQVENMFAKLKDWRRIAMRYDRCAHTFFSAICLAATFMFYLKE